MTKNRKKMPNHTTHKAISEQEARLRLGLPRYSDREVCDMDTGERNDLGLAQRFEKIQQQRRDRANERNTNPDLQHKKSDVMVATTYDLTTQEQVRGSREINPAVQSDRTWLVSHSIWAANNNCVVEIMSRTSFEREQVAE